MSERHEDLCTKVRTSFWDLLAVQPYETITSEANEELLKLETYYNSYLTKIPVT